MKRRFAALAVAACVATGLVSAPTARAAVGPGSFTRHTYASAQPGFDRDYTLYVPTTRPADAPLVVYLHGCSQTAEDAAIGTRWNELAEELGFVVVYPEQALGADELDTTLRSIEGSANGARCWNWFRPEQQARGGGELETIVGITRSVAAEQNVDRRRIYVLGASAGANMATNLGAAYPDVYAATGAIAGCPFLSCGDETGAAAFDAMGDFARRRPVFVVDGTAETISPYAMSEALVQQWLGTNDLADNGLPDNSVNRAPTSTEHIGLDASLLDGLGTVGDTCLRPMQWPCPGGALGVQAYPYTVRTWDDDIGTLIEMWTIHGLSHNYPNGDPDGTFTDPHGPDVNRAIYAFFMDNRGPSRGRGPASGAPKRPRDVRPRPS